MQKVFFILLFLLPTSAAFSQDYRVKQNAPTIEKVMELKGRGRAKTKNPLLPDGLKILMKAYPDVKFTPIYMAFSGDFGEWKVFVTVPNAKSETFLFYYANGSMLPESELQNRDKYWSLIYNYAYKKPLQDPSKLSKQEIERMRIFGSDTARKSGKSAPMFFFDAIYGSYSRKVLESRIIKIKFFGKTTNVHKRLKTPLERVEKRINYASLANPDVKEFLDNIKSTDAFHWRQIVNTNRKSFHSLGIAIDILPKKLGGKAIYWSWEKERNSENWMLTPLERRWMPPEKVINIFEEEGFIWGGKWAIFDNMHFEYHPELILNAKERK